MLRVSWEFCISPVQVVSSISGNIITIMLDWITPSVINSKIKSYTDDSEKNNTEI